MADPSSLTTSRHSSKSHHHHRSTREIAALDFLLNIPLEAERSIVREGLRAARLAEEEDVITNTDDNNNNTGSDHNDRLNTSSQKQEFKQPEEEVEEGMTLLSKYSLRKGPRWWDKLITHDRGFFSAENKKAEERARKEAEEELLELPNRKDTERQNEGVRVSLEMKFDSTLGLASHLPAPGRRLDGVEAQLVKLPAAARSTRYHNSKTRVGPGSALDVARISAIRQWEISTAHGIGSTNSAAAGQNHSTVGKGLLDGRAFASQNGGYPLHVFSVIKYMPEKEEAARRRKKLEALGGGGTQFAAPTRDWRGVSYKPLIRRTLKSNTISRNIETIEEEEESNNNNDHSDDSSLSTASSSEASEDYYTPGFLDDPNMSHGKHRHVMIGDKVTGPVVSSIIQFVKPTELKSDLNRQFRERFDGWEPNKNQREIIGAQVVDGVFTLKDPTEVSFGDDFHHSDGESSEVIASSNTRISRPVSSKDSMDEGIETVTIRMPPSLTLSKIRSVKKQAVLACYKINIEVSTVALACVFFERLCLDCRVDKSNRRLTFAVCLILAYKLNEPHVALVLDHADLPKPDLTRSMIRQTTKSQNKFSLLLEFFANEWGLSLKNLFDAEWGVFAALGFRLHSTPHQVAFHFKRLMKLLEKNVSNYLGTKSYNQWQESLATDSRRKQLKEQKQLAKLERKKRKLLMLQRKLQLLTVNENESQRTDLSLSKSEHDFVNTNNTRGVEKQSWIMKRFGSIGAGLNKIDRASPSRGGASRTSVGMKGSKSSTSLSGVVNQLNLGDTDHTKGTNTNNDPENEGIFI